MPGRSVLALALALGAEISLGAPAARAPLDSPADALPYESSPFGFLPAYVGHIPDLSFVEAVDIGIRWNRPSKTVFWAEVQPDTASPVYDWTHYDPRYRAEPPGINLMSTIEVEDRQDPSGYSRPGSYLPIDIPAYRAFVRAAVERYDGDQVDDMPGLTVPIHYWQVSNEISDNFTGFAQLQAITYTAIKEACADCQVLIGGVGGMPDGYLDHFNRVYVPILAALAGQTIDIFDFHW